MDFTWKVPDGIHDVGFEKGKWIPRVDSIWLDRWNPCRIERCIFSRSEQGLGILSEHLRTQHPGFRLKNEKIW